MSIAANIKMIRERRGMTQSELAEPMGVEQTTVARWESGQRNLSADKMVKLAGVLGVEISELTDAGAQPSAVQARGLAAPATPYLAAPTVADLPRDLPVLGSVLGADLDFDSSDNGAVLVERLELNLTGAIDYVKRPQGMRSNAAAYALYVQGDSMSPRLEQGDLIYVDTRRPPAPGDDVVVQLCAPDGDDQLVVTAMVKRLVRRSSQFVELEQFSPNLRFKVPVGRVHAVHRVVRLAELLGL